MSKIEVDQITEQSGTTITVGGGACKTAVVDATTVTLGRSGATVSLHPGASQSGFGRTGTVDWCSTVYTNSPGTVTAVSGKGYFLNTSSGAITINLPSSPSFGDIVAINDYGSSFCTNNVIVGRNSSKINGVCQNAYLTTKGQSVTLVYVDGTRGWKSVTGDDSDTSGLSAAYVAASGGTETTSGDYKIHTFTSDGTFTVSNAGNVLGSNKVSYVVVAGGGGGGGDGGGGGGAGGFREGKCTSDPYTDSPLDAGAGLSVSAQAYPITVGGGGSGNGNSPWSTTPSSIYGSNSVFSSITSAGGGGSSAAAGGNGGSGGGGGRGSPRAGGTGNTPPVSPAQGTNGGPGGPPNGGDGSGGGGGATVAGSSNPGSGGAGGAGGAGATSSINATPTARAGGGGGGATSPHNDAGGAAGTGGGGKGAGCGSGTAAAGTTNTGGGGGGSSGSSPPFTGGAGGSGVVIIRYKYQN